MLSANSVGLDVANGVVSSFCSTVSRDGSVGAVSVVVGTPETTLWMVSINGVIGAVMISRSDVRSDFFVSSSSISATPYEKHIERVRSNQGTKFAPCLPANGIPVAPNNRDTHHY